MIVAPEFFTPASETDVRICAPGRRDASEFSRSRTGTNPLGISAPAECDDSDSRDRPVKRNSVLSLFPGVDLFGRGFEAEGFSVVRGPDRLWGGDVKRFRAPRDAFDGVIGGPPCQRYSTLARLVKHNGDELAEDLIPEFERLVAEARPRWFLMENVPEAPVPRVAGYVVRPYLIDARMVGCAQQRKRRFSFGTPEGLRLHPRHFNEPRSAEWAPTVIASTGGGVTKRGRGRPNLELEFKHRCRLQGLDDDFELPSFTAEAKCHAVGNGVPVPLARALARAIVEAISL